MNTSSSSSIEHKAEQVKTDIDRKAHELKGEAKGLVKAETNSLFSWMRAHPMISYGVASVPLASFAYTAGRAPTTLVQPRVLARFGFCAIPLFVTNAIVKRWY